MKTILFLLTILSLSAHATPFADGDAKRGEGLFKKYECSSCHEARVGGDGSAIFTRADRTVRSADDLIVQMERCSGAIGKQLSAQEKQDLAAWLNQRYYHFK
ncbi:MAG: cytochrome c [Pseudomonadota bacterium]